MIVFGNVGLCVFYVLKRKKNELKPTAKDEGQLYHFSIVTVRYRQKKTKSPKFQRIK